MRLKLLLIGALLLAATGSPSAAQLPPLPLPDVREQVEETTKQVEEDAKKTVDDTGGAVGETLGNTLAPSTGSGSGGEDGSGGGRATSPAPTGSRSRDASPQGGGMGTGTGAGSGTGVPVCPGEGLLGGGVAGNGPSALAGSSPHAGDGGLPPGERVLGAASGGGSDDAASALEEAAARTGPLVLAIFAFGALLLLVGLAGGLRALQGRLRG